MPRVCSRKGVESDAGHQALSANLGYARADDGKDPLINNPSGEAGQILLAAQGPAMDNASDIGVLLGL